MAERSQQQVIGILLTIGDEILLGDIPNGNAHYIASELRARGFRLDRMITVGDREEEIVKILCECVSRSHYIIVTGGLGPTDDDRTCAAVCKAFDRSLVMNDNYADWLRNRLSQYGMNWTEHVARMAQLPEGAVKLGMEMAGFFIEHRSIPCYFLPGVPHEMKTLLTEAVIPDLEQRFPNRAIYLKHILRVQGITESDVNESIKDLTFQHIGLEVGYLPQVGENWVTLFATAESHDAAMRLIRDAEGEIIRRIGSNRISGHNEECLELVIGTHLRERNWKLAVAESCTGGLLSSMITAIPGASEYFDRAFIVYSNRAKSDLLKVSEDLLAEHGAVSEPVAAAMAEGARKMAGTEVALGVTGIAGPAGGSDEKPVGTVFLACATPEGSRVEKHVFSGARSHIQQSSAQAALVLLWRMLTHDSNLRCH